jgi:hypothetical protein
VRFVAHGVATTPLGPGAFTNRRTAIGSRLPRNVTRARAPMSVSSKPKTWPKVQFTWFRTATRTSLDEIRIPSISRLGVPANPGS